MHAGRGGSHSGLALVAAREAETAPDPQSEWSRFHWPYRLDTVWTTYDAFELTEAVEPLDEEVQTEPPAVDGNGKR